MNHHLIVNICTIGLLILSTTMILVGYNDDKPENYDVNQALIVAGSTILVLTTISHFWTHHHFTGGSMLGTLKGLVGMHHHSHHSHHHGRHHGRHHDIAIVPHGASNLL